MRGSQDLIVSSAGRAGTNACSCQPEFWPGRAFVTLTLSLSLLRGGLPGARWIDVENYHMTLRFIGDVEGHVADEIANALDRVRRPSFSLTLSGVGSAFRGVVARAPAMIAAFRRRPDDLSLLLA